MPNPSKTLDDYQKLAHTLGLEFISDPPHSVREPVNWRCPVCGRVHLAAYNKMKYVELGCRCQGDCGLTAAQYHQLAQRLGIKWVARTIPHTNMDDTQWLSVSGILFSAPYHRLGYSLLKIPSRYYAYLPKRILTEIQAAKEERLERIRSRTEQL